MGKILSLVLAVGVLIGVSGEVGCARVPEARARGVTAQQDPPCPNQPAPTRGSKNLVGPDQVREYGPAPSSRKWGIETLGVNLSAAGYMLDFRYRVTDPEKARLLMDGGAKPYLVDQATGARMRVPSPPKIGPLRQKPRKPIAGRTYFVLFANPGRYIKAGNKVTVVMGDCQLENLFVE